MCDSRELSWKMVAGDDPGTDTAAHGLLTLHSARDAGSGARTRRSHRHGALAPDGLADLGTSLTPLNPFL